MFYRFGKKTSMSLNGMVAPFFVCRALVVFLVLSANVVGLMFMVSEGSSEVRNNVATIRITEVSPYGTTGIEGDWVELLVLEGEVDISGYVVSSLDSTDDDEVFSADPVTVYESGMILLHFNATAVDETDATGDTNGNGVVDIYVNSSTLSGTNEQLVLYTSIERKDICDAVCWSNGVMTESERTDVNELVEAGEWVSNLSSDMVPSGDLEKGISLARKAERNDANNREDWYLETSPSPGKKNRVFDFQGEVFLTGVYLGGPIKTIRAEVISGGGNISTLSLSDLDGASGCFGQSPLPLLAGDVFAIHYGTGFGESDDTSDLNGNGIVDIYYNETPPTGTMDSIVLYNGWEILDAVAWSSGTVSAHETKDLDYLVENNAWVGNRSADCCNISGLKDTQQLVRITPYTDTNSSRDWEAGMVPGVMEEKIFDMPTFEVDSVECSVSPDSSYRAMTGLIDNATDSINIEVYIFDNYEIGKTLLAAQERGVMVTILLEGSPIGGIPEMQKYIMSQVVGKGGIVRYLIHDEDVGIQERYPYIHAKFMVVDNEHTFITSENFRMGGIPYYPTRGNRGWSIVVNSNRTAEYFEEVFRYDISPLSADILEFSEDHENYGGPLDGFNPIDSAYQPKEANHPVIFSKHLVEGNINVTPVLCPDHTSDLGAILPLIEEAQEYIYVQQHSVSDVWWNGNDFVDNLYIEALHSAARRGVRVRMQYDETFKFSSDHYEMINRTNKIAQEEQLDMLAIFTSNEALGIKEVHNKGMIVDGKKVLISSINWATNSVYFNREMGLIIENSQVADYYKSVFEWDWKGGEGDPTGRIFGHIKDQDGMLLTDITMFLQLSNGSRRDVIPDNSGYYSILAVPQGVHYLHVTSSGFQEEQIPVSIGLGNELQQDITLLRAQGTIEIEKERSLGLLIAFIGVGILVLIICVAIIIASLRSRKADKQKVVKRISGGEVAKDPVPSETPVKPDRMDLSEIRLNRAK